MPKNKAMEEMPGNLKTKFITGERSFANILVIAVCWSSSEIIRNGSSEGTITVDQSIIADCVEESISVGKTIQKTAIKNIKIEKIM